MLLPGCGVALLPVRLLVLMKAIIGLCSRAVMSLGRSSDFQLSIGEAERRSPGVLDGVGVGVKVGVSDGCQVG